MVDTPSREILVGKIMPAMKGSAILDDTVQRFIKVAAKRGVLKVTTPKSDRNWCTLADGTCYIGVPSKCKKVDPKALFEESLLLLRPPCQVPTLDALGSLVLPPSHWLLTAVPNWFLQQHDLVLSFKSGLPHC